MRGDHRIDDVRIGQRREVPGVGDRPQRRARHRPGDELGHPKARRRASRRPITASVGQIDRARDRPGPPASNITARRSAQTRGRQASSAALSRVAGARPGARAVPVVDEAAHRLLAVARRSRARRRAPRARRCRCRAASRRACPAAAGGSDTGSITVRLRSASGRSVASFSATAAAVGMADQMHRPAEMIDQRRDRLGVGRETRARGAASDAESTCRSPADRASPPGSARR